MVDNLKKRGLMLLSGGLDSTAALWWALDGNYEGVKALTFRYGSKEERVSIHCAYQIANRARIGHDVINLDILSTLARGKSSLMEGGSSIPEGMGTTSSVWVPARNLVMLSVASSFAEGLSNAVDIIVGFDEQEARTFPDNSRRFVRNFNKTLSDAVLEKEIKVVAPLIDMDKKEIVRTAQRMGAPIELSCSCYRPRGFINHRPVHCGSCQSCILRHRGFLDAGVKDPTDYEVEPGE